MGRKSWILFLVGLIFAMSGLNLLTTQVPPEFFALDPSVRAHLNLFSIQHWGQIFAVVGLLAMLGAILRRWTVTGYFLLMGLSTFWGALYLVSWSVTGYWRSIFGTSMYFLISGFLYITSAWPEVRHAKDPR